VVVTCCSSHVETGLKKNTVKLELFCFVLVAVTYGVLGVIFGEFRKEKDYNFGFISRFFFLNKRKFWLGKRVMVVGFVLF